MPKAAILKTSLNSTGGLEKYTFKIAEYLEEMGFAVTLLAASGSHPRFNTVLIPHKGLTKSSKLYALDQGYRTWLESHPQDLVIGMERCSNCTHYRAGNGVHAAYLQHRALTDSRLEQWASAYSSYHRAVLNMEKALFASSQLRRLIVNSRWVKGQLENIYSPDPKKISVIPNGVEWEELQAPFDSTQKTGPFHFLFIGNGYKRKGLDFLLRGLALLRNEEWRLTVIGKERQPRSYLRLAAKLRIADRVTFAGMQKEIIPYYQQADALVIPSIYDPFANVTLEALAMGLTVISSRYNGGKEVIQAECGRVIESLASPDSVADALRYALKHPKLPDRAAKIRASVKPYTFTNQLKSLMQEFTNHAS